MPHRRAVRSAVFFAIATLVLASACARSAPRLVGTVMQAEAAPDFTLTDGLSGRALTLSAQRGKVVALTFLYTQCPDVCPLTAEELRQAQEQLSAAGRDRVAFIAISVDPRHDSPEAVQAFAKAHRWGPGFAFLVGGAAQLQPVWTAYGVRAEPDPAGQGVGHSDAVYLIDATGRGRVLTHSDIAVRDLVSDLEALAAER